jgi:predicted O-methyltransferase YrrM
MRLYEKLPAIPEWKALTFEKKKGIEIEPEFGALLYGLVRMHKPMTCVETGTYIGDSSEWIGKALRDNGHGKLVTCDTDIQCVADARERLRGLPVEVVYKDGADLLGEFGKMDFIHLDGGYPKDRDRQLAKIGDHNVAPGGLLVWHDACVWCPEMYETFAPTHNWPHLIMPTQVGVAIFQRPQ